MEKINRQEIEEIQEILQENIKTILARKRLNKVLNFIEIERLGSDTVNLIHIKEYMKEIE